MSNNLLETLSAASYEVRIDTANDYPIFLKEIVKDRVGSKLSDLIRVRWADPDNLKLHPLFTLDDATSGGDIQPPISVRTISTQVNGTTINNKGAALSSISEITPSILRLLQQEAPELPGGLSEKTAQREYERSLAAHQAYFDTTGKIARAVIPLAILPVTQVHDKPIADFLCNGYTDQLIAGLSLPLNDKNRQQMLKQLTTVFNKIGGPAQLINFFDGIDLRLTDALGTIMGDETISLWENDPFMRLCMISNSSAFPSPLLEWTRFTDFSLTNSQIVGTTLAHLYSSLGLTPKDYDTNSDPQEVIKQYWDDIDSGYALFDRFTEQMIEFTLVQHANGISLSDRTPGNGGSLTARNVTLSAGIMDLITAVGEPVDSEWLLLERMYHDWYDMALSLAVVSRFLHPEIKFSTLQVILSNVEKIFSAYPHVAANMNYEVIDALSSERTVKRFQDLDLV